MASAKECKELEEKGIQEGSYVSTKYRGGVREGYVKKIITSEDETPHPPKVVFDRERRGDVKEVQHNPSTLQVHPEKSRAPAGSGGEPGGEEGSAA